MKFLVFVISSLTVAHCGYHSHDDGEGVHVEHHEGATSYQNIHMEHFHPVPTYIKKEDKHWLEHPISLGSSSSKVEIHHGGKHDHGYAIASVENDLHGHSLGDGGGGEYKGDDGEYKGDVGDGGEYKGDVGGGGEYRGDVGGGGEYGGDIGGGGEYGGDIGGGETYGHQGHSEGYSGGQESDGASSYEVHDQGGEYSHNQGHQGQDVGQDAALGQAYESHYAQLAAATLAAHHQGGGIPAAAGLAHHRHHNHNYHAQE